MIVEKRSIVLEYVLLLWFLCAKKSTKISSLQVKDPKASSPHLRASIVLDSFMFGQLRPDLAPHAAVRSLKAVQGGFKAQAKAAPSGVVRLAAWPKIHLSWKTRMVLYGIHGVFMAVNMVQEAPAGSLLTRQLWVLRLTPGP